MRSHAWGKVQDECALIFFDPRAIGNFGSPEMAANLGICSKMGSLHEASLAAP